jgi:hypothetical protein
MEPKKREMEEREYPLERSNERYYPESNFPWMKVVLAVVIVLIIIGAGWLLYTWQRPANQGGSGLLPSLSGSADSLKIDQGKYQAVFLTNGQVYFGKIMSHDLSYLELADIYYIQVVPVLQQGEGDNKNDNKNQEQQNQISLVKLGNEIHGPLDRMMINRDQVAFVEDLKDDSKVTQAISQYIQNQQKK